MDLWLKYPYADFRDKILTKKETTKISLDSILTINIEFDSHAHTETFLLRSDYSKYVIFCGTLPLFKLGITLLLVSEICC